MKEAVIVAAVRTAIGKAPRGTLRTTRPDDMAAAVIKELLRRTPALEPHTLDDIIIGCATPERESGNNVARIAALRAGVPCEVPAATVHRFCASGSETIAAAATRIMSGMADCIIAGGTESMSLLRADYTPNRNPYLASHHPEIYMSMGQTAETVARQFEIAREDADAFALQSHRRAHAAQLAGKLKDDGIIPLEIESHDVQLDDETQRKIFERDEGVRPETSLEALAKLRPVFDERGSVTAGNSSKTSDGAAAVLIMSRERAAKLDLQPLARFVSYAVAGVPPEIMGMGPVPAVPQALKRAGLKLDEIDLIELNEAFACQTLAVMRELDLDLAKVNVNGGAIAHGHPLGATGTILTVKLLGEMRRRKSRFGLVTMCVGGGQGAASVFERE